MKVIWHPFWYGGDQSIEVGRTDFYDFFVRVPDYIVSDGNPVFYHGDWSEKSRALFERKRAKILSIYHPQLGHINALTRMDWITSFS